MTKTSVGSEDTADLVEKRFRLLLDAGAKTPVDSSSIELKLPSYYDADKFLLGQKAFANNVFAMMVAKLAGLLTVLAVPSILNVLKFTKQSGTSCSAFQRYVATILHTFIWYEKNPEEQCEFLKSLKIVRRKHCLAFKRSQEAGLDRITQLDMALTQFGFIGFSLLSVDELGISVTEKDLEGLVHLWRVVGNMVGIEERFNLCSGNVEETKALCERLLGEVFLPYMAAEQPDFNEMGRVLLEGMWAVVPVIEPVSFKAFTYRLADLAAPNNNHTVVLDISTMPTYSRFLYEFLCWVHRNLLRTTLWWSTIGRAYVNQQMKVSVYLMEHLPFLAYWQWGRKRSHVTIFKTYAGKRDD